MTDAKLHILLVGESSAFHPLVETIQDLDGFILDIASTTKTARFFLRRDPAVVILHMPGQESEQLSRLEWLQDVAHQVPVIVLADSPETALYLNAMEHGAFDCLSIGSTGEEMLRVLTNALRWQKHSAA